MNLDRIAEFAKRCKHNDSIQIDAQRTRTLQDMQRAAYPEYHANNTKLGLALILGVAVGIGSLPLMFQLEAKFKPSAPKDSALERSVVYFSTPEPPKTPTVEATKVPATPTQIYFVQKALGPH